LAESLQDGRVLEFESFANLISCVPAGELDLLVLAAQHNAAETGEMLRWAYRNWPGCRALVICQESDIELERVVRQNGGLFFISPVSPSQWHAVLQNVLHMRLGV
jgi:hypothetical protein